jgi:hypothetical protein
VRYQVTGDLTNVTYCHCSKCRRWHGHIGAYTAVERAGFALVEQRGLKWYAANAKVRRGFCGECGSSLFWDPPGRQTISISAGTLDSGAGLKVVSHWFVSQAGAYYELPDDGLPHHEYSGESELP